MTNNDMTGGSGGATSKMHHLILAAIRLDEGTQARVTIDPLTVAEYAEAMTEGETLPAPVVFFDGAVYYLADGFHRFQANRQIGATTMLCEVRCGDLRDARLFAYGANRSHGLRRTSEDKRKAVQGMLANFPDMSDRGIARHVGVSDKTVAAQRAAICGISADASTARTVERGGKTYTQDVSGQRRACKEARVPEVSAPLQPSGPELNEPPAAEPSAAPAGMCEVDAGSTSAVGPLLERIAELEQLAAELLADNKAMSAVLEADEQLVIVLSENKQLRAQVAGLRERVAGLMNEKNEAIRLMKHWRKRAEKAQAAA